MTTKDHLERKSFDSSVEKAIKTRFPHNPFNIAESPISKFTSNVKFRSLVKNFNLKNARDFL